MKQLILIISLLISNLCLGCPCYPTEMRAQIEIEAEAQVEEEAQIEAEAHQEFLPCYKTDKRNLKMIFAEEFSGEGNALCGLVREKIGSFLKAPKEISYEICGVKFEFVRVDQADGSFLYFGKYPVTQKQWIAVMGSNPSKFHGNDRRPVEQISYNDIVTGFLPRLNGEGQTYRLPTEQEWGYAALAGSKATWPWGDDDESRLGMFAWYWNNSGRTTHAVGDKDPNDFGLYDMLGNVWEWTSSPWSEGSSSRVVRGGGWYYSSQYLRPAYRRNWGPATRSSGVGFRLVRTKP